MVVRTNLASSLGSTRRLLVSLINRLNSSLASANSVWSFRFSSSSCSSRCPCMGTCTPLHCTYIVTLDVHLICTVCTLSHCMYIAWALLNRQQHQTNPSHNWTLPSLAACLPLRHALMLLPSSTHSSPRAAVTRECLWTPPQQSTCTFTKLESVLSINLRVVPHILIFGQYWLMSQTTSYWNEQKVIGSWANIGPKQMCEEQL